MGPGLSNLSSSSSYGGEFSGSPDSNGDRCATRKVVSSNCRTEEVEPGKFIRKCEKTEQVFKDCFGRPSEMVQSNKEYTEEDVTDLMVKDSYSLESAVPRSSYFPGLRSDIEAIERDFLGGINRFFEAAEEMKKEFFDSVGVPDIFDKGLPSPYKHGIPIEGSPPQRAVPPKENSDGDFDLSGMARDV